MAVRQPYTPITFEQYLLDSLGATGIQLGWQTIGDLENVVVDTLLLLGVDDITTLVENADLRKLRVAGQLCLWRQVMASTAGDYTFSADGGSYSRDQVFAHAQQMMAQAEAAAAALDILDTYAVTSLAANYHIDPYADYDDDLAVQIAQGP